MIKMTDGQDDDFFDEKITPEAKARTGKSSK